MIQSASDGPYAEARAERFPQKWERLPTRKELERYGIYLSAGVKHLWAQVASIPEAHARGWETMELVDPEGATHSFPLLFIGPNALPVTMLAQGQPLVGSGAASRSTECFIETALATALGDRAQVPLKETPPDITKGAVRNDAQRASQPQARR